MHFRVHPALLVTLLIAGCGGGGLSPPSSTSTGTGYSVSANVSGLAGTGLTLATSTTTTAVKTDGTIPLTSGLQAGATFAVTVYTQPVNPLQTCTPTGGSGTISNSDVTVTIVCVAASAGTINTAQAIITLDSSVPASVFSIIAEIVSPLDSEPTNTPLYIPISANGETVVLAVDSNQNILLASMTATNSANLSATSTALVLVRLTIGALPNQAAATQLDTAIESTAEFPNLVSEISAALAANTAPGNDVAVDSSISTIVTQLPQAVIMAIQAKVRKTARASSGPGPVSYPSVTTPLPFTLMSNSSGILQGVTVTGTAQAGDVMAKPGDVKVANSTLISWAFASATTSGQNNCSSSIPVSSDNPDCYLIVGPTEITQSLAYNLNRQNTADLSTGIVPGNNGGSFNLTLEQNYGTHFANITQIAKDSAETLEFLLTDGTPPDPPSLDGCVEKFIDAALPSEAIGTLAANSSAEAFVDSIKEQFTAGSVLTTLADCGGVSIPNLKNAKQWPLSQAVLTFVLNFYKKLNTVAIGLSGEIGETSVYWSYGKSTFGVCEAQDPKSPPPSYVISNCAQSLAFIPTTVTVVPGMTFTPGIGAAQAATVTGAPILGAYLNASGDGPTTLVPPDLVYSPSQNDSVVSVDPATGAVQALALPSGLSAATAVVSVGESSTNLSASYTVNVNSVPTVVATSNPANLTSVGGPATLSISVGPPTGTLTGSPTPTGTITFADSAGATFCPQQQPLTLQEGAATCPISTPSAPDFITVKYNGDTTYSPTTYSVAIGLTSGGMNTFSYAGKPLIGCVIQLLSTPPFAEPPPGPISGTIVLAMGVPANFSGTIGTNQLDSTGNFIASVTLSSFGVGTFTQSFDGTPKPVGVIDFTGGSVTFLNGSIQSWALDLGSEVDAGISISSPDGGQGDSAKSGTISINDTCGSNTTPGVWSAAGG